MYLDDLKPGDIILTKGFRGIVVWFLNLFQRDKVHYGHVSMAVSRNCIIEAGSKVRQISVCDFLKQHKSFKIIRFNWLSFNSGIRLVTLIKSQLNTGYGWSRFLLQILDNVFHTNYFTKLDKSEENQICSSLVAWTYFEVLGINFNDVPWNSCEPDDIEDEVEINSGMWTTETWHRGRLIQSKKGNKDE